MEKIIHHFIAELLISAFTFGLTKIESLIIWKTQLVCKYHRCMYMRFRFSLFYVHDQIRFKRMLTKLKRADELKQSFIIKIVMTDWQLGQHPYQTLLKESLRGFQSRTSSRMAGKFIMKVWAFVLLQFAI